jgi:hypothetical protein
MIKKGYTGNDEEKEIAKEIFGKIDIIISQCKSDKPVPFEKSKFRKLYKKLKEKYGINEEVL